MSLLYFNSRAWRWFAESLDCYEMLQKTFSSAAGGNNGASIDKFNIGLMDRIDSKITAVSSRSKYYHRCLYIKFLIFLYQVSYVLEFVSKISLTVAF